MSFESGQLAGETVTALPMPLQYSSVLVPYSLVSGNAAAKSCSCPEYSIPEDPVAVAGFDV